MTAVGVYSPCSHFFGVVNATVSPVFQTGGCTRALSIEIPRKLYSSNKFYTCYNYTRDSDEKLEVFCFSF